MSFESDFSMRLLLVNRIASVEVTCLHYFYMLMLLLKETLREYNEDTKDIAVVIHQQVSYRKIISQMILIWRILCGIPRQLQYLF